MALKLCTKNCKIFKLGGILFKRFKYNPFLGTHKTVFKQYHRSFLLPSLTGVKQFSLEHTRSVSVSSALWGKLVPFKLSDIGEGIVEVTVKEWFVKPGDTIAQFDNVCEVQSDKASVTITSRYDGVVKKLYHKVDDIAKVGNPLIDIEIVDESSDSDSDAETPNNLSNADNISSPSVDVGEGFKDKALATPAVRRIAKENNIDIQVIKGSGKGGRVLKEDILLFVENAKKQKSTEPIPPVPSDTISLPSTHGFHEEHQLFDKDRVEEIAGFKKAMVKSMVKAWSIPHFSYCDEVDAASLIKVKDEMKRLGQTTGVKLTFMPFFIKAASLALMKYPRLNSHISESCDYLTIKASHNIGVAMDTNNGLIVPNIKNVERLSLLEIARELNRLQELGAKGQLGLEDLKDGTFTLSNIGSIGGTYTKPIIFPPQVIIGALGKIQTLPRFDENQQVSTSHIFNISWSADHRVIDGATVARFSNLWKEYLTCTKLLLLL